MESDGCCAHGDILKQNVKEYNHASTIYISFRRYSSIPQLAHDMRSHRFKNK